MNKSQPPEVNGLKVVYSSEHQHSFPMNINIYFNEYQCSFQLISMFISKESELEKTNNDDKGNKFTLLNAEKQGIVRSRLIIHCQYK